MKKIIVLSAIAAMVLASCTTKETIETPVNNPVEKGKVTLKATVPSFESTKASVNASGKFAWTSGDKIDVVYTKAGSSDKTYEFTYNGTDFEYVGTIEKGYAVSAAYYPVGYAGTASTQNFASLGDAAKGFQMTATVNAGVLEFAHDNAMLHVKVNNVPSFAKALTVGGSTITLSSPAASIEAFVPVAPAASAKLSIALSDGTNDIISKSSKNAAAISAAKMYPLNDLEVNKYIVVNNSSNSTHRLGLGIRKLNGDWVGSWATFDFNVTDGIKYYVLPDTYAAAEAIQVELRQDDGSGDYAKSTAEYMIPVRNLIFDASDNSLKTAYRCYASFTDSQWGYWIAQGSGTDKVMFRRAYDSQPSPSASDVECSEVVVSSGKLFYYEFLESEYGYGNVYWGFYNDQNTGWVGEWDNATINRDFIKIM